MLHAERIASFIAESPAGFVSQAAIERAKLALVDYVGVAVAGTLEPVSRIVVKHVGRAARGQATVIGAEFQAGAADAALANGATGHALDFDDSSFVLGGHPSVTLLPALLAVGEERGSPGRDILESYVIGFEVMMKIARAVNFEHYEKGWHPTATLGIFGATAAVAHLMRMPARVAGHALGLAASMTSGIKANFGSMAKPFQVGQASQKGVWCAQLAADGLTASPHALEGRQGFLAASNGAGHCRAEALSAFGTTPELVSSGLMFKKYPCCGATHAPIDAALDLVRRGRPLAGDIEAITIVINSRRLPHVDRPLVTNGLEAKFSVQYTVAAALTDGAIGLRHFGEAAVARPELRHLAARVTAVGADSGDELSEASELTVKLKDGSALTARREHAEGRANDAYRDYMAEKFTDCIGQVADRLMAENLLAQLLAFERCTNVGVLMERINRTGRSGEARAA